MNTIKKPAIFAFWTLLLACVQAYSQSTPSLWFVEDTKTGGQAYIFGSMHFGQDAFYPFPKEVDNAFKDSQSLVVEVDITLVNPADTINLVARLGALPPGQSLTGLLNDDLLKEYTTLMSRLSLDVNQFESFQPWLAVLQLASLQIQRLGYDQTKGVDIYFLKKAANHNVIELESLEEQLTLFSALDMDTQVKYLEATIQQYDEADGYLTSLAQAWKTGNDEALTTLLLDEFKRDVSFERLFQKLFTDRNIRMAESIGHELKMGKKLFVVVGAGHLLGDSGLIELFSGRYSVKKIRYSQ